MVERQAQWGRRWWRRGIPLDSEEEQEEKQEKAAICGTGLKWVVRGAQTTGKDEAKTEKEKQRKRPRKISSEQQRDPQIRQHGQWSLDSKFSVQPTHEERKELRKRRSSLKEQDQETKEGKNQPGGRPKRRKVTKQYRLESWAKAASRWLIQPRQEYWIRERLAEVKRIPG